LAFAADAVEALAGAAHEGIECLAMPAVNPL
jgi:hypothetical protein